MTNQEATSYEKILRDYLSQAAKKLEEVLSEVRRIRLELDEQEKSLRQRLAEVARKHAKTVEEVEDLRKRYATARKRLAEASRRGGSSGEAEQRAAYKEADDLRLKLVRAEEREKLLRKERDFLEVQLRLSIKNVQKAELAERNAKLAMEVLTLEGDSAEKIMGEISSKEWLLRFLTSILEEDRRKIARELHDNLAQELIACALRIDYLRELTERMDPTRISAEMGQISSELRQSALELRNIIFNLRADNVDNRGLFESIRILLGRTSQRHSIRFCHKLEGDEDGLSREEKLHLYRIVQEAVNNAAKHSRSDAIEVELQVRGQLVRLSVKDFGTGFSLDEIERRDYKGFGLHSMRERAKLLGGELEIKSNPGGGTEVIFERKATAHSSAEGGIALEGDKDNGGGRPQAGEGRSI